MVPAGAIDATQIMLADPKHSPMLSKQQSASGAWKSSDGEFNGSEV